jgi:hypothetical protein
MEWLRLQVTRSAWLPARAWPTEALGVTLRSAAHGRRTDRFVPTGGESVLQTLQAVVRQGRIELLEPIQLADGTHVLVTVASPDDDQEFWLGASQASLDKVWDYSEDDVYAELLEG